MKQFFFLGRGANDCNLLHYFFPDNFGNLLNSSFLLKTINFTHQRSDKIGIIHVPNKLIIEFMMELVDKGIQRNKHYHKIGQQKKMGTDMSTQSLLQQNGHGLRIMTIPPKKQFITDHLSFPPSHEDLLLFLKSYLFCFNSNFNGSLNDNFLPLALNSNHFIFARCRSSFTQS
jgi:hypothetical protein